MGNSDSKKDFKNGSLLITLDNKHFMSGQTLTGSLSYKLDDNYPGNEIVLELVGKEKLFWDGKDSKNTDPKHSGKIVIKRQLFKVFQTIHRFADKNKTKGMQSFKFALPLPKELPSSILFVG